MGDSSARHHIAIDFSPALPAIRPLHGVTCGPLYFGGVADLSRYHAKLAIPHTRLHDCHWPSPNLVDIPCIFSRFDGLTE